MKISHSWSAFRCDRFASLLCAWLLVPLPAALAQPVLVTLKLDAPQLAVGATTTLHVSAQIAPDFQLTAAGIFSWYIDVNDLNADVARPDYAHLKRPTSDQNPRTSSPGIPVGANQTGIYDTFLKLPQAGHAAPVELLALPITAVAPGIATFRVLPGTGVPSLSADFLTSPAQGSAPLVGADYSSATVELEVTNSPVAGGGCILQMSASFAAKPQPQITITFLPCLGKDHVVEFSDTFPGNWTALPGAPHNSGTVTDAATSARRFYRVRLIN